MRRRLIITCIGATLFLGGWGSALAAALCSHAGTHAGVAECCRRKQSAGEAGHGTEAAHSTHAQTGQHEHAAAAASSDPHDSHGAAGEESDDAARAGVKVGAQAGGAGLCTHCVERPSNLPPSEAPTSKSSRGGDRAQTAHVHHDSVAPNTQPFAPPVTPKQGSPPAPPASRRHLLLGVFLI